MHTAPRALCIQTRCRRPKYFPYVLVLSYIESGIVGFSTHGDVFVFVFLIYDIIVCTEKCRRSYLRPLSARESATTFTYSPKTLFLQQFQQFYGDFVNSFDFYVSFFASEKE